MPPKTKKTTKSTEKHVGKAGFHDDTFPAMTDRPWEADNPQALRKKRVDKERKGLTFGGRSRKRKNTRKRRTLKNIFYW